MEERKIYQRRSGAVFAIILIAVLFSTPLVAQVDADATVKTKALYGNLKRIQKSDQFLFGQEFFNSFRYNSGNAHGNKGNSDSKDVTGSHPALLGSDFHYYLEKDVSERSYHTEAVKWAYQQGCVITFDWHIRGRNTNTYQYNATSKDLANNIVNNLNGDREWFYGELDKIIDIINHDLVVDEDTIPIVFRPFHEMNGNWFWWGSAATNATNYKALYALIVDYVKARTKSVLFCWSPNTPVDFNYYPGNNYIDIIGVDGYEVTTATLRTQLGLIVDYAQANNKIAVFAETGYRSDQGTPAGDEARATYWKNTVLPGIMNDPAGKAKKIAWVLTWINSSWSVPYVPHASSSSAAKQSFIDFKNSTNVLFADEVDDMYTFTEIPVAIEEDNASEDLRVYPVPANDFVTVKIERFAKPSQISLYDSMGKLVYEISTRQNEEMINVKEIASPGIYILRVSDKKRSVNKKIRVDK